MTMNMLMTMMMTTMKMLMTMVMMRMLMMMTMLMTRDNNDDDCSGGGNVDDCTTVHTHSINGRTANQLVRTS